MPAAPAEEPPRPASATPATPTAGLPNREELTLAWGDHVLDALPRRSRARFGAGRFVDVRDDAAVFGLPNPIHRDRCEECRDEVEDALAAHFGRPVPLVLVVDDREGQPPPGPAPGGRPVATVEVDEHVDLDELADAPDAGDPGLKLLTDTFPGAVVEDAVGGEEAAR